VIERSTVLRRAADLRFRLVVDEGVVVRQSTAEALVVSEVGARLLDLIDGRRSVGELLELLVAEYDVAPPELERDVASYLEEILALGLVLPADAGA
jgi:hypothetical protein